MKGKLNMNNHVEWTEAKNRLIKAVSFLGFPQEFGEVMARQLGSPKAIDRMTSYVYQAKPRTEEMLVDEMLAICEEITLGGKRKPAGKLRKSIIPISFTDGRILTNRNWQKASDGVRCNTELAGGGIQSARLKA